VLNTLDSIETTTMRNLAGPQMPWKSASRHHCRGMAKKIMHKNQTRLLAGGFDFEIAENFGQVMATF
jgi:hypothetical protein